MHCWRSTQYLNMETGAGFPARMASGLSHAMMWQSPTMIELYITKRSSFVLLSHSTVDSSTSCMYYSVSGLFMGMYFCLRGSVAAASMRDSE